MPHRPGAIGPLRDKPLPPDAQHSLKPSGISGMRLAKRRAAILTAESTEHLVTTPDQDPAGGDSGDSKTASVAGDSALDRGQLRDSGAGRDDHG